MKVNLTPDLIAQLDGSVMRMIGVANELIALASEESQRLNAPQPMAIDDLLLRKRELVEEYEKWIKAMANQRQLLLHANPTLFNELLECNKVLSNVLNENTQTLEKAMTVNKRRVDTIMRAIRESSDRPSAYGNTGRYAKQYTHPSSLRPPREA